MSFLGTIFVAACFEYSGLHYLWKFHISNYPIVKGARGVWKNCNDVWNANGLAKRRAHRIDQVEKRGQLQERNFNDRREIRKILEAV